MSANPDELPRELPGREPDDALAGGVQSLDDVRKKIHAHVDDTQGAWLRQPLWRRAAPLALSALAALGWVLYCMTRPAGAMTLSAWIAFAAGIVAFSAVAVAQRTPGRAERIALTSVFFGIVAALTEAIVAMREPPVPGDDVVCARAIVLGALVPMVLAALHVRLARTPARPHHVAATALGGLLLSMGAVWTECPATALQHVATSHLVAPAVAFVVLAVAARPLLRGARLH